jgi:5-keto 4-deoxyuronate isomerase
MPPSPRGLSGWRGEEGHRSAPRNRQHRTIYQFIHPDVMESCQLVWATPQFHGGSVWNTMPAHLHDRRMEAYLYFDLAPEARVFHLMGEPQETRHLVVANEEAVMSPPWSIHCGCGHRQLYLHLGDGGRQCRLPRRGDGGDGGPAVTPFR